MAKKTKEEELDFFYLNNKEKINTGKQKKKSTKKKPVNKTTPTKKKKSNSKKQMKETLSDNEIIIGVNTKPKSTNSKKTRTTTSSSKKDKPTNTKKKTPKPKKKKTKVISTIIKIILVFALLGIGIMYLVTSPTFNIQHIHIVGNQKISSETYVSLSEITIGNNIYNLSKNKIIHNIKQNPYVDTVVVKRKLPDTIEVTVTERKTTYMLNLLNSYAYINNQGYILEINEENLNLPIITGYSTSIENIVPGNRLYDEDLLKLETVLKIMDTISINGISETINEIDIQDESNFTLRLTEEKKIVYLGDASNLGDRILYLKAVLQKEKGKEGEIFINGDLSKDKVFFREKV